MPARPCRVDTAVIHPRHPHLNRARAGQYLAGLMGAVAHDQSPPVLVTLVDEPCDVVIDLGLQGPRQHPPGTLRHELVDQG